MKSVLHKFITEPLFDATEAMLSHLHIKFTAQSKTPLSFAELYSDTTSSQMPQALQHVVDKINSTYLIGAIDEDSLEGRQSDFDIQKPLDGKYQTMLVFAVDIMAGLSLTRGELATLTRGFNRMAPQLPVVVFVKNGDKLTLATCERSEYRQNWREGEKLGKVSILRDINCAHPHRGHIDILETLGDEAYPTFDELYKHWLAVFSSELLTKKFYTELSEWYAWVINSDEVKFPNDITTTEDDTKFNHEAVIRLITRLIFVWFLKQKHLIPNEFFDEKFITEHFIENFDPHSTDSLFYDPKQSKYYRLILQNLFFAMLNRPIKDEESGNEENRRFANHQKSYHGISPDHNINNLLRYRSEFKTGGADLLLKIANSTVPFLNGGLFECLDDKENKLYFDGFSEYAPSLEQLAFPDYFFFGDEVGKDVDLSSWYDDKRKQHVHVRGIIDILRRYNFTVEENTPLDQEVSLDPELLGKVFENLLASYNPETKTSARKQTGSFYTPREIVQYMVDESLVSYLKRTVGEDKENIFRSLFDYSNESIDLSEEDREKIIHALYECKILDPACGSGAFPVGALQQMVHALSKLDPSNALWKQYMIDIAISQSRKAYQLDAQQERDARLEDINQAFNNVVNDPDYARKLFLIENCIFGVDIQPIAIQISKLRFFISLVAEQNPTDNPLNNFGIRPLPNLEAKFVAANSLMPLQDTGNLMTSADEIRKIKESLTEANHKLFRAKRNAEKRALRRKISELRLSYAEALKDGGAFGDESALMIAHWDMFNQNSFAQFFNARWMFDIENGFDIVIANPPYVEAKKLKEVVAPLRSSYKLSSGTADLSIYFFELAFNNLKPGGVISFITTNKFFSTGYGKKLREHLVNNKISKIINFEQVEVFENVLVSSVIVEAIKEKTSSDNLFTYEKFYQLGYTEFRRQFVERKKSFGTYSQSDLDEKEWSFADENGLALKEKIESASEKLVNVNGVEVYRGVTTGNNDAFIINTQSRDNLIAADISSKSLVKPLLQGRNVRRWYYNPSDEHLIFTRRGVHINEYPAIKEYLEYFKEDLKPKDPTIKTPQRGRKPGTYNWYEILDNTAYYPHFEYPEKIIWGLTADKWAFTLDTEGHYLPSNGYILTSDSISTKYLLGLLNSKLMKHYFSYIGVMTAGGAYTLKAATIEALPVKIAEDTSLVDNIVTDILAIKKANHDADVSAYEDQIDKFFYHLYKLSYDDILIIDPETTITEEEYNRHE